MVFVIGGLMHARPRFVSKKPKWQVEGFLGWDYPDDAFLIIRV
jgi:hypothetical protein